MDNIIKVQQRLRYLEKNVYLRKCDIHYKENDTFLNSLLHLKFQDKNDIVQIHDILKIMIMGIEVEFNIKKLEQKHYNEIQDIIETLQFLQHDLRIKITLNNEVPTNYVNYH